MILKKNPNALIVCLILLSAFLSGCNNTFHETNDSDNSAVTDKKESISETFFSSYITSISAMRSGKDASILSKGLIETDKVKDFKGLQYFEPDSTYILKAKFTLLKPEKVIFHTTDERAPEYFKFCKFSFNVNGIDGELFGYVESAENPESIFVPFKDATSNKETYGGGRYVDIDYNGEKTMILLDFNYAYNPYCHYNHQYSCPLVPAENILKMAIRAGEKKLYE